MITAYATHNRAGEITYKQISNLTFEITLITYTYTPSPANASRDSLEINWGDNTFTLLARIEEVFLPDNYTRNRYVGIHTYPGTGVYQLVVEDPNRNYGVGNIPNSVNVPFSIKTTMLIDSELGVNSTPVLLSDPIDKANVGEIFIHNPTAYDPDGDSLSYKLTVCTGADGKEIPGYTLPEASSTFTIDEITGDMTWDAPVEVGIYNVAILIEEWREGVKIGKVIRDMQIEVHESDNSAPQISDVKDICVEAGDTVEFTVKVTDADNDNLTLNAIGGVFEVNNPAQFNTKTGLGTVSSNFTWNTACNHVRLTSYQASFKVTDSNSEVDLVDISTVEITVVGPAPENIQLKPTSNSIELNWDKSRCSEAIGYYIYRRRGSYGFTPNDCETGVPAYTGYEKITKTEGLNSTSLLDNNAGEGLPQGYEYCYMVTAYYQDGAESYASEEVCASLIRGIPTITNVDVLSTDDANGSIYLAWSKPTEIDFGKFPGPYRYKIYRSEGIWGVDLKFIKSNDDINDTTYTDNSLNTLENPYSYKIEMYDLSLGQEVLIATPHIASSIFLEIEASDNQLKVVFEKNVPWLNSDYVIYRLNESTSQYDSLDITHDEFYIDAPLANGLEYCYRVKSIGGYQVEGIINPIINNSQEKCGSPLDTISPCTPKLVVESNCDSLRNELTWNNPNLTCADDVVSYNLYYSISLDGKLELLTEVKPAEQTSYLHYSEVTMAGCYAIAAVDSFQNESELSNKVCLDNCIYYELPNMFTPNGDGINDFYKPGPYQFVDKVDMKIFNRWGNLIFETENPDINWNGTYMENGKLVSPGVYYYICDVYEYRLVGLTPRNMVGFIHVFTDKDEIKKQIEFE